MAKQIDERVVSMQFDNQKFEKNVSVTMHTLDKLKEKLNFQGASKGLEEVNKTAKKVDMSALSNGVEAVRVKFSALEVMGITALTNITNSAVNAGKRMVKALSFDSVRTGFSEYETKINAVQTIMSNTASKGKTMEDVTKVLNELNTYADKTIYNFAEMTKNIGTFTAAGVDLEDSAKAIQGIANLAASSGSTSQQASTAMYQLSQALAAGTVKLMDWNSVVNAGMGGEKFQNALKQTAREHGVAVDKIIKKNGSFRESLSEGWISAEILNETLNKFTVDGAEKYAASMLKSGKYTQAQADALIKEAHAMEDAATKVKTFTQLWDTMKESAQSGWAQTWELIVGDFEEAKEFFSELSEMFGKVIGDSAESRNKLISDALGSRYDTLIEKINKAGVETEDFMSMLKKTAKESGIPIDNLIKKHGSLAKVIKAGKIPVDIFVKTLRNLTGAGKDADKVTGKVTQKVQNLEKVVKSVIRGNYGNGADRVKALTKAGYDYATVQDLVNKTLKGQKVDYNKLSTSQLKNLGYTEKQIKAIRELADEAEKSGTPINELIKDLEKPSGRELLLESITNSLKGLGNILGIVKKEWQEAFKPIQANQLYDVIASVNKLTDGFLKFTKNKDNIDKLSRSFRGLFAVLDIITTITSKGFTLAIKTLGKILGFADLDILSMTAHVGDAIVAFRDWLFETSAIAKGFDHFTSLCSDFVRTMGEFFDTFVEMPAVSKVLTGFEGAMSKSLGGLDDHMAKTGKRFKEFMKRAKAMDGLDLNNIDDVFKDFKENVLDYFFNFDGVFDNMKKALKDFKITSKKLLKDTGDGFKWFFDKLVALADFAREKVDFGEVIALGMGVGVLAIFKKFGDALETLSDIAKGFDISPITKGIGDAITNFGKAKALEVKSRAIKNIAISIAILSASLIALSRVDQKTLWATIGALAVLSGIVIALAFAASKMGEINVKFSSGSRAILMVAASLLIMVSALKMMDNLNPDNLGRNIAALLIMAAGLATVAGILGNKAPQLSKGTGALIIMAVAVKLMVSALKDMNGLDLNLDKTIVLFVSIIGGLMLLAKACKGFTAKTAFNIVAAVIALKLLVGVLDDIAEIDMRSVSKNLGSLIVVFGLFAVLMKASSFAGANVAKAGVGILGMSLALLVVVKAVDKLSKLDPEAMKGAAKAIGNIILIFAAVIAASHLAGPNAIKAGVMLILMSGALLAMTVVIAILKNMKPDGLDQALGVIKTVAGIFAVLIAVTKLAQDVKGTLITLTTAVTLLSVMLIALSFIKPDKLRGATIALTSIMGVFGLLIVSLSTLKTGEKHWKRSIGLLVGLVGAIAILGLVIFSLSKCRPGSTIEIAESLALLMVSLSACMLAIGGSKTLSTPRMANAMKGLYAMTGVIAILGVVIGLLAATNPKGSIEIAGALTMLMVTLSASLLVMSAIGPVAGAALGSVYALSGVIAILALILGILAKTEPKDSLEIAASLSVLLLSLSASCLILAGVGATGPAAFIGIGALLTLITAVGALMAALGALVDKFPKLEEFINKGLPLLETIGYGIGAFVGNIVGGLLAGVTSGLPEIGQNISDFVSKIASMETIDNDVMTSVKNLVQIITLLSAARIADGIATFLTGNTDMSKFGEQLGDFGKSLGKFAKNTKNLDANKVKTAATAGLEVAKMASAIPNEGGMAAFFAGDNRMENFGKQLGGYGKALTKFSKNTSDLDTDSVKKAASAGKLVADMADSIPNEGGIAAWFAGDNRMESFGAQLSSFGTALSAFSHSSRNVDLEVTKVATQASNLIIKMADAIPNEGGLLSVFSGDNDMTTFGSHLSNFGTALSGFSFAARNVDLEIVKNATKAAKSIISMAKGIPDEGGLVSKITGDNDLTKFGSKLVSFANKMSEYNESIKGIDVFKMGSTTKQFIELVNMTKNLDGINTGALKKFGKNLGKLGKSGVNKFIEAFKGSHDKAKKAVQGLINASAKGLKGKNKEFKSAGTALVTKFVNSIKSDKSVDKANSAGKSLAGKCASAIKSETVYSKFKSAGSYVVSGFASGISESTWKAEAKARAMANAAEKAAREALDINSPSKIFRALGKSVPEGFAMGIGMLGSRIKDSVRGMAGTAVSTAKSAIARVAEAVNGDMDVQPTIRPVVDLSDVTNGANAISNMLAMNPSVGLMSNVGAISSLMNGRQNAGNDDVVSAIKDLGKTLSGLSGDTYTVGNVTYDDGSNIVSAVQTLVGAARRGRRV